VAVRKKVDIREVARVAGVSVTTVSHALNGKGRLPEETRTHVRGVADRLGYTPSATARNLVGGKTGLLGLVISQPTRGSFAVSDFTYFTEIMAAATAAAMARGYALVLAPPHWGLGERGPVAVDGAIVIDPLRRDPLVREFARTGIPVVTTGRALDSAGDGAWIDNDHVRATRRVLDHLAKKGAKRIGLLTNPTRISYTVDVEDAYCAWCEERQLEPMIKYAPADLSERAGFAAGSEMLRSAEPPDAIHATYDRLAYGVVLAAEALRIRIPDDLLLAMTATNSGAPPQRPTITSLDLHPAKIGRFAAELLVDLIEEREPLERQVVVSARLIARGSTSRAARQRSAGR
jgi:DNA-binding LacI/PurR family transcriptional regulator